MIGVVQGAGRSGLEVEGQLGMFHGHTKHEHSTCAFFRTLYSFFHRCVISRHRCLSSWVNITHQSSHGKRWDRYRISLSTLTHESPKRDRRGRRRKGEDGNDGLDTNRQRKERKSPERKVPLPVAVDRFWQVQALCVSPR
ncbi:Hypothetical predicted protein, partial [Scomber scombrus]